MKLNNKYDNYDIAFLGGLFPKEMYDEVYMKSRRSMQNAANVHQWNIVEGMESFLSNPIKLINLMFVGSYPKNYKDLYIKYEEFSHSPNAKDFNASFLNLTLIKHLHLKTKSVKSVDKWLKDKYPGRKKILIIYAAISYFLEAAKYVKNKEKDTIICLIVPDLPDYIMLGTKNPIRKFIKYINIKSITKNIKYVDKFVFLSEAMNDHFDLNKPYVVVEGIYNTDENKPILFNEVEDNIKRIVYTGTLTKIYGILNLVEAFQGIPNDNYRLIICGSGETEQRIKELAESDSRIIYKGFVPYNEIMEIQRAATVLVNPRQNNFGYTKYSFPSKTMEYLASGRPVIGYKLDGIPNEYDKFLIYCKDDTIETLRKTLIKHCELEEKQLRCIGEEGRDFIMKSKNKYVQGEKILSLLINSK